MKKLLLMLILMLGFVIADTTINQSYGQCDSLLVYNTTTNSTSTVTVCSPSFPQLHLNVVKTLSKADVGQSPNLNYSYNNDTYDVHILINNAPLLNQNVSLNSGETRTYISDNSQFTCLNNTPAVISNCRILNDNHFLNNVTEFWYNNQTGTNVSIQPVVDTEILTAGNNYLFVGSYNPLKILIPYCNETLLNPPVNNTPNNTVTPTPQPLDYSALYSGQVSQLSQCQASLNDTTVKKTKCETTLETAGTDNNLLIAGIIVGILELGYAYMLHRKNTKEVT